jgi:hypothetical protein
MCSGTSLNATPRSPPQAQGEFVDFADEMNRQLGQHELKAFGANSINWSASSRACRRSIRNSSPNAGS